MDLSILRMYVFPLTTGETSTEIANAPFDPNSSYKGLAVRNNIYKPHLQ